MLHTSNKYLTYHLEKTVGGKIRKVQRIAGKPTLDENAVKFTRLLRKTQEQIHAALKQMFPFLNLRKLWLDCLKPLTLRQLTKFGLPGDRFEDLPRLNYLVTVCCSLINFFHPGFKPLFMNSDNEQIRLATIILKRLFLENPLLHPEIWPVELNPRSNSTSWTEISFSEMSSSGFMEFPQLTPETLTPTVFEIASGANAINQANSSLTYMKQLLIKGQNLTRQETEDALLDPPNEWKLKYTDISTPPVLWDEARFGTWSNVRIVGCKIPPSNKSSSPANFHWAVIVFGRSATNRLGMNPPYDRIYFYHCFGCPALNGSISMDRHIAALLEMCSFRFLYKPTNRTVNLLNTVADRSRKASHILPASTSVDIPVSAGRRSRDRRSGNPLYGGDSRPARPSVSSTPSASTRPTTQTPAQPSRASTPTTVPPSPAPTQTTSPPSTAPTPTTVPPSLAPTLTTPPPSPAPSPTSPLNVSVSGSESAAPPSSPVGSSSAELPQVDSGPSIPQTTLPAAASSMLPPSQAPSASAGSVGSQRQSDSTPFHGSRDARRHSQARETSSRRFQSRSRSPGSRLVRHLRSIMQQQGLEYNVLYNFPLNPSPFLRGALFTFNELQQCGLQNDGNVCPILSIILSFHRLQLKDYLKDPDYEPNLPTLVLYRILQAMPSLQSFSIMQFVLSWNDSNLGTEIRPGQFGDVIDILDSFLSELDIKTFSAQSRPVFTKYLASFNCSKCGKSYQDVQRWDNQWNRMVPFLNIPNTSNPANVWDLLSSFLATPVQTKCPDVGCGNQIQDGVLVLAPGIFTVLAVNRLDFSSTHDGTSLINNKLSIDPPSDTGIFNFLFYI